MTNELWRHLVAACRAGLLAGCEVRDLSHGPGIWQARVGKPMRPLAQPDGLFSNGEDALRCALIDGATAKGISVRYDAQPFGGVWAWLGLQPVKHDDDAGLRALSGMEAT